MLLFDSKAVALGISEKLNKDLPKPKGWSDNWYQERLGATDAIQEIARSFLEKNIKNTDFSTEDIALSTEGVVDALGEFLLAQSKDIIGFVDAKARYVLGRGIGREAMKKIFLEEKVEFIEGLVEKGLYKAVAARRVAIMVEAFLQEKAAEEAAAANASVVSEILSEMLESVEKKAAEEARRVPNTDTRVVDHLSEYTNDTFSALAAVWNKSQPKDSTYNLLCTPTSIAEGFADGYIANAVNEALNETNVDESGRVRPGREKPFNLLIPVLEGRDHWVGIMISCDGKGKIIVTSIDPLDSIADGSRTTNVTALRANICTKLRTVEGVGKGVEDVNDEEDKLAVKQSDKIACGPYVFEGLTTAATNRRRADPGRIALRQEQLNILSPDSHEVLKEISFSKEQDELFKKFGDVAFARRQFNDSDKSTICNDLGLVSFVKMHLQKQSGVSFKSYDSTNRMQDMILRRILFYAQHDEKGLRKGVLMQKLRGLFAIKQELEYFVGLDEFIEHFKSNKDVDNLPPEVYSMITDKASYEQKDFVEQVENKMSSPASALSGAGGSSPTTAESPRISSVAGQPRVVGVMTALVARSSADVYGSGRGR